MIQHKQRVILVGVGARGMWAVIQTHENEGFEPVAMVDLRRDYLEAAARVNGLSESFWFTSVDEAMERVDADCMMICTPTVTHADIVSKAFHHGLHVLVEKAMANNLEEAECMVETASRTGLAFCVAQNYRFFSVYQEIKRILDNECHPCHPGKVEMVDLIHHRYRPEPRTQVFPGAMVWDMSCHHFDLLDFLFASSLKEISARSYNPSWSHYPYPANLLATLEYECGVVCQYALSHDAAVTDIRLLLQGPCGALSVDSAWNLWFWRLPERQFSRREPELVVYDKQDVSWPGVREVVDAFYRQMVHGEEAEISGRNNLRVIHACHWLLRAIESETKIRIPSSGVELQGDAVLNL